MMMQIDPNLTAKLSYVKKDTVPVILYSRQTIADIRDCILENYGKIKYELPFINAVAVELSKEKLYSVSGHRMIQMVADDALVTKVSPSPRWKAAGYSRHQPPAQEEKMALGHGAGVGIAFIDTGIAPHYDLIYPFNRLVAFHDLINGRKTPYDDDGHGTHVAGIAAGNGFCSGRYIGTAPSANLIGVKALDDKGNGTASDILAALQWIIDNQKRYHIRVVNLSLGVPTDLSYGEDPLIKGANAAVESGLTVVAAAGNSGPGRCTINSPGTSPYVITVGAADLSTSPNGGHPSVASFSSRGPTPRGFLKPDLLAPGVEIVSLSNQSPKSYAVESGTSMAAPFVAGAAASLYAMKPELTPALVKRILMQSASPLYRESMNAQGRGVLDIEAFASRF